MEVLVQAQPELLEFEEEQLEEVLAAMFVPAKEGDAGYDLVATEDFVLPPGEQVTISAGIAIALPEPRMVLIQVIDHPDGPVGGVRNQREIQVAEMQVRSRSGNAAKKRIAVTNAPGTIDSGYRGTVQVILENRNPVISFADLEDLVGNVGDVPTFDLVHTLLRRARQRSITFKKGDRIAQAVFDWVAQPVPFFVEELPESDRGEGGLGHTGLAGQ